MHPKDHLHCLTIDFSHASPEVRACFALEGAEIRHLLRRAGRAGVPLIVLCTPVSMTLISTSDSHVRAFSPVFGAVRERTHSVDGWQSLRVRSASGSEAGKQLAQQAITPPGSASKGFMTGLRAAVELSGIFGALSGELDALLRMIEQVTLRVRDETRLEQSCPADGEIEIELLAAQRIVEEELVAWRSSHPALRTSLRPVSHPDLEPFSDEERHSMVRIRVAGPVTKLQTA